MPSSSEKKKKKKEAKAKAEENFTKQKETMDAVQKKVHDVLSSTLHVDAQETHSQGFGAWTGIIHATCDVNKNRSDPCGDGDQSALYDSTDIANYKTNTNAVQQLRNLWSEGGDFNPYNNQTSKLMKAVFLGQKSVVQSLINAELSSGRSIVDFVNRRESVLRMYPHTHTHTHTRKRTHTYTHNPCQVRLSASHRDYNKPQNLRSPLLGLICGSRFVGKSLCPSALASLPLRSLFACWPALRLRAF
jgi:hypothetical protein